MSQNIFSELTSCHPTECIADDDDSTRHNMSPIDREVIGWNGAREAYSMHLRIIPRGGAATNTHTDTHTHTMFSILQHHKQYVYIFEKVLATHFPSSLLVRHHTHH